MFVESIFPAVIEDKSTLEKLLRSDESFNSLVTEDGSLVSKIPSPLIDSGAFLDKMTKLWRYEFGMPYELEGELLWGTDVWVPVEKLKSSLEVAAKRLKKNEFNSFMERLNDIYKHLDVLVEMYPGHRVNDDTQMEFEVEGHGEGNKTIDWLITPKNGRRVLLDVKRRKVDLIHNMDRSDIQPKDEHDHSLMFRSIEKKFKPANPESQLQGAWIVTSIKQNLEMLTEAFNELDSQRVHFAIFGDWREDVLILSNIESDKKYISELFKVNESSRFVAGVHG